MKLIYHAGTGTVIDAADGVYVIDTADLSDVEYLSFTEGDESVLEEVLETGRATTIMEAMGQ